MKYLKILLAILLISVLFSGCGLKLASSIDELISPLSPFGDNADIKNALDEYAKGGYSLKTPNAGKYITSYSFFDIDGDETEEAVAFYEPADDLGTINMALIQKDEKEWKVIENIKGDGTDIHSVEFADITHNGEIELIVCWDVISHSTNHELSVYSYKKSGKKHLIKLGKSMTVNNYIIADLLGEKKPQLLLFETDTANSSSAKAELYSYEGGSRRLLGETKLDAHITGYETLQTESIDDKDRVYADALGSDGNSMLTELIYWSDAYDSIVSPFYSYNSGLTKETARSAMIQCMDVDSDGRIDIPTDYKIEHLPDKVSAVEWQTFRGTVLKHTGYALLNKPDGYIVVLPDEIIKQVQVTYNNETGAMTVTNQRTKKEMYSVMSVLKAAYSANNNPGYTLVSEGGGYCYLVKVGNDTEYNIPLEDMESYIIPIKK